MPKHARAGQTIKFFGVPGESADPSDDLMVFVAGDDVETPAVGTTATYLGKAYRVQDVRHDFTQVKQGASVNIQQTVAVRLQPIETV